MLYRRIISPLAAIGMFTASMFCHAQTTASCTFSTFNAPSGYVSAGPNGINNYDTIVGDVVTKPTQYTMYSHGLIRYSGGGTQVYNYPNAAETWLTKRNNNGVTVGYFTDSVGHRHGLVKNSSSVVQVTYPAAGKPDTFLTGINKWGSIVGRYLTYVNNKPYFSGFELQNGKYTTIWYPNSTDTQPQAINDNGVSVGWYTNSPRNGAYTFFRGFLLRKGTYTALNDPQGSTALGTQLNDINVYGVIAGNYVTADSNGEFQLNGFIYENGTFKNLVYPGAISTTALGINDYKTVVGVARVPPTNTYTYIPFKAHCN
ncbi:MAG: hypothetical protein JWO91_1845 [Acidobacteriaceae bacterium]|nr:hypothetical protein [Acidobacteriaceae bacterium]